MPSEGSREASGLETAKGAVRERIGLARQPRHSRVQGTTRKKEGESVCKTINDREASFDCSDADVGLADFRRSQMWSISRAVATSRRDQVILKRQLKRVE